MRLRRGRESNIPSLHEGQVTSGSFDLAWPWRHTAHTTSSTTSPAKNAFLKNNGYDDHVRIFFPAFQYLRVCTCSTLPNGTGVAIAGIGRQHKTTQHDNARQTLVHVDGLHDDVDLLRVRTRQRNHHVVPRNNDIFVVCGHSDRVPRISDKHHHSIMQLYEFNN